MVAVPVLPADRNSLELVRVARPLANICALARSLCTMRTFQATGDGSHTAGTLTYQVSGDGTRSRDRDHRQEA